MGGEFVVGITRLSSGRVFHAASHSRDRSGDDLVHSRFTRGNALIPIRKEIHAWHSAQSVGDNSLRAQLFVGRAGHSLERRLEAVPHPREHRLAGRQQR
jgi:hypothetical protein